MAFNWGGNGGDRGAYVVSSASEGPQIQKKCTYHQPVHNNNRAQQQQRILNKSTDGIRRKRPEDNTPHHILLFNIFNPTLNPFYEITVDVLHKICHPHGQVERIVIFRKNGVQAMVEFNTVEAATRAREHLYGRDIYPKCWTLNIYYAKKERLNLKVYKNDTNTGWDYTLATAKEIGNKRSPLLEEPLYGTRPQPYKPPLMGPGAGFPPYEPPDFHQTTETGKGARMHPTALMMESPLAPGRNGQLTFPAQEQQHGSVMMVSGLDEETSNTDKLFNLLCVYGNVVWIKFLTVEKGTAIVRMGDSEAVERCIQHLNNIPVGNNGKIQITVLKQNFQFEVFNPFRLPDHISSFKEYTDSRNNRFLTPAQASNYRLLLPSKILHFFNTPPWLTKEQLIGIFNSKGVTPTSVTIFPPITERSSWGLIEFTNIAQAVLAIMMCNHEPIKGKDTKFTFIMKLRFSLVNKVYEHREQGGQKGENDRIKTNDGSY